MMTARGSSSLMMLLVVLLFMSAVRAEIIPYLSHPVSPLRPEYLQIAKFSKSDAPHWSPGHGHSYIDLQDLRLNAVCAPEGASASASSFSCSNSTFDLLMFEEPRDKFWMDYWPKREFCCTREMVDAGDCFPEQEGTLLVPTDLEGAFVRSILLPPNEVVHLHDDGYTTTHHDIATSDLYILLMAVCDPNSLPVTLDGMVVSLDPYGYLPADLFGNLPFYGALSCMYSIVGIVWLALCACHADQLMPLQLWITVVLAMGMIETTFLFAHYLHWNDAGTPTLAVTLMGLLFGVSKRAVSRIVVQFVALGYGVVRPSLGEDMTRVLQLGGSYFILSLVYTIVTTIPSSLKVVNNSEFDLISMVVFLLAAVDTIFYIWIITSINNLLVTLAARKQAAKYLLYRNFRAVLFVSLFFTCVWALYGSVVVLNDGHGVDNNWRDRWTVDALWELTYFTVFCCIGWMWAPSKNSQRYAYSIELTQLEGDSEYESVSTEELSAGHDGAALDAEYGKMNEGDDPFQGTGALDHVAALNKKQ